MSCCETLTKAKSFGKWVVIAQFVILSKGRRLPHRWVGGEPGSSPRPPWSCPGSAAGLAAPRATVQGTEHHLAGAAGVAGRGIRPC